MINNTDAVRLIDSKRNGSMIVPTMNANNVGFGLPSVTTDQKMDLPLSGAMGKASSLGLGLALAQPYKKVFVLDGDGSLLMNLGTLVTVANKTPKNLYHFLFNNGVYAVTGGQPIPGSDTSDWEGMAKAAGYAAVFSFDDLEDFTTGIDEVLATEGPVFIHLAVEPQIENTPVQFRPRSSRTVQMAFRELPEALGVR
ncbi:MAG TPA: thiamine pyrophosphate-dependent enzyme [Dehalococcoidia bacterium]|jgi:thiamine pyrophosphate-dependent acetolactate synthase large subunit-like protein|nr:thiamine pyrophosphate-dependent enzyme [Dehalococcoidia bacterium]